MGAKTRLFFAVPAVLVILIVGAGGIIWFQYARPPVKASRIQSDQLNDAPFWKNLYAGELSKHIDSISPKFNIYDLDGDGTPELLISDDGCRAASAEIFTVHQGKLASLGEYGSWGELRYSLATKRIFSLFETNGDTDMQIYEINNSKAVKMVSFFDTSGDGIGKMQFQVNGKDVTESQYRADQAKYGTADSLFPFVRKYSVTKNEIARVLEEIVRDGLPSESVYAQGKQFVLISGFATGWHYFIYNKNGSIVDYDSGGMVTPKIQYISDNVIEIHRSAGTYVNFCKYYNVDADKFSEQYDNPFLVQDGKIIYFDYESKRLIIRDIFDKSAYYREFKLKDSISLDRPPESTELINSGKQLRITYYNESSSRTTTETIELD